MTEAGRLSTRREPLDRGTRADSRLGPAPPPALEPAPREIMACLRGTAVSPGLSVGAIRILDARGRQLPPRGIGRSEIRREVDRLERAIAEAHGEALAAESDARRRLGPEYADILSAHARMISDESLRRDASRRIEQTLVAAEHAVLEILDALATKLERLSDRHLAARAADVRDIESRILDRFAGKSGNESSLESLDEPCIVISHDLSPSQTAGLDPTRVLGFATEVGGRTSHTAIVAAALGIPAVVGLGAGFLDRARSSRRVIIDGDEGSVILDPDTLTERRYSRIKRRRSSHIAELQTLGPLPAETRDGVAIELLGNIEFPDEITTALRNGAVGIGLYRTEFLYLNAQQPPSEDQQLRSYSSVIRAMRGRPVTIRTLDLGADKLAETMADESTSRNPFLGLRSIRLSLRQPELFRIQLRAILRASVEGDVRLMFPMVTTLDEWRRAKTFVQEVREELGAEGHPVRCDMPLGVMIEVPAAAVMADKLAKEVDFFSIGTNDLIQYALAVDRTDETVANLYSAGDPAVLRLIRGVVEAARRFSLEVDLCGSMGGEPLFTPLLVGMGLRQLSMPPLQIGEVKRIIRAVSAEACRELAEQAIELDTASEVTTFLRRAYRRSLAGTARPGRSQTKPNHQ